MICCNRRARLVEAHGPRMKDSDALCIVTAIEMNPAHESFAAEHGLRFTTDFAGPLRLLKLSSCARRIPCTRSRCWRWLPRASMFCENHWPRNRSVQACREARVVLGIGHGAALRTRHRGGLVHSVRARSALIMHAEAHFSHDKLAKVPEGDWHLAEGRPRLA